MGISIDEIAKTHTILRDIGYQDARQIHSLINPSTLMNNSAIESSADVIRIETNIYIKNLQAITYADGIEAVDPPDITEDDTEEQVRLKALNYEWESARVNLQVLKRKYGVNADWLPLKQVAVKNSQGYPYREHNLLDLLTDSISYEFGADYELGVLLRDVGYGNLQPGDRVIIDGSFLEQTFILREV
ncbi:hypothetical protein IQ249_24760 [Lusitaniella coriacea LEGE 07157]|uniref:Uncharacterized protein n=1 Tax=Lusitaniella coriacea LEGE 07157 TaxID=945747 RepID=A0A8J7IXX8_9CYAN|nr:hypothetical protein [Lusitaniella coriacea]MBE9119072.1 hypothetical protein [Lusitaniella coriacea LEGE 07157]